MCSTNSYNSPTNACNLCILPGITLLTVFITNVIYLTKIFNCKDIKQSYENILSGSMVKRTLACSVEKISCLRRVESDGHNFGKGETSKKYLWIPNFHFAEEGRQLFDIE